MCNKTDIGKLDTKSFVDTVTTLMVTGNLGEESSNFTVIYGDFIPMYIESIKNQISRKIEKIPDHTTDNSEGSYNNYFWVNRPDGSTGCIKLYGRQRIKGCRWEGKRPDMAMVALKTGVSRYTDEEIYAGILPSLTPQNPSWIELEITDAP